MTLFDMKKTTFENAVRRHSKEKGLNPPPIVSITENPCPSSSGETAHIHIEERIICIWKKKLEELTLDQINKVAAHEVAHLISIGHGGKHAQAQAEIEIADWGRSVGGVVIHGGKEVAPSVSDKPIKPGRRKKICSYHSCRTRTELGWCPYCESFFCIKHLEPKRPRLPPFKKTGPGSRRIMEEWRKDGHPCPSYPDYLKLKKKEQLETFNISRRIKSIEKDMVNKKFEQRNKKLDETSHRIEPIEIGHRKESVKIPIKKTRMRRFAIIAILVIGAIVWGLITYGPAIWEWIQDILFVGS